MYPLVKQHFLSNSYSTYITIIVIIGGLYLIQIPPVTLFIITLLAMMVGVFYYDDKNKMNRFIVSLPVKKSQMIQSRYVYFLILAFMMLVFQSIVMVLSSNLVSYYQYGWRDFIVVFCIGGLIISVGIPIYYFVRKFLVATGIILFIYFIVSFFMFNELSQVLNTGNFIIFNELDKGYILLAEKYIPYQPFILLPLFVGILMYGSMKVSERIFLNKDM